MQILALAIYRGAERRVVRFNSGRLNVITGWPGTGKSSLLEIVEYCLGRTKATFARGALDVVEWYGLLIEHEGTRVFVARPAPREGAASASAAMVQLVASDVAAPDELTTNADTDTLREQLTRLIGIEDNIAPVASFTLCLADEADAADLDGGSDLGCAGFAIDQWPAGDESERQRLGLLLQCSADRLVDGEAERCRHELPARSVAADTGAEERNVADEEGTLRVRLGALGEAEIDLPDNARRSCCDDVVELEKERLGLGGSDLGELAAEVADVDRRSRRELGELEGVGRASGRPA